MVVTRAEAAQLDPVGRQARQRVNQLGGFQLLRWVVTLFDDSQHHANLVAIAERYFRQPTDRIGGYVSVQPVIKQAGQRNIEGDLHDRHLAAFLRVILRL